jgi:hypothetical protein
MSMTFAAVYAIVIGVAMIGQWTVTIVRGQVPTPEEDPVAGRGLWDMLFHWAAEFLTAIGLLIGGLALLMNWSWALPLYLVATGMLLYSLINSPGYFAQLRQWPMVAVFGVMFVLALASLILVL